MPKFRLILLLSVAVLSSGYRWRCYAACDEQTSIQNDYVEQRDECREEAQNNLDAAMAKTANPNSEKARKAKLVVLFSDCMGKFGWDVPVPAEKADKEKVLAGEVPIYVSSAAKTAAPKDGLSPAPAPDNTAVIKEDREAVKTETNENKNIDNTGNPQKSATKTQTPDQARQGNIQKQDNSRSARSNTTTTNNIAQKPQNQPSIEKEADQPENMRVQPATTGQSNAHSLTQQQQQNAYNNRKSPIENNRNSYTESSNTSTTREVRKQDNIAGTNAVQKTYNNEENAPEKSQPEEMLRQPSTTRDYQPIQKPRPTPKRKPLPEQQKPAPVTTITPDTADQALNESIQKPPAPVAQNKIQYRNKAAAPANDNTQQAQPKIIPQQPATTPRAATPQTQQPDVIQPAQPTAKVAAKSPDNADQALVEAMKKRPSSVAAAKATTPANDSPNIAKSANTAPPPASTTYAQRPAPAPAQAPAATNSIVKENNTVKETVIYKNNPPPPTTARTASAQAHVPAGNNGQPAVAAIPATTVAPALNANASGETKIPSQPAVTKGKQVNPRAAQCEQARRNAATSPEAAQQAKQCDIECDKILKAAPKIINPAPCPVKDAAVNILDLQLGNKK